MSAVPRVGLVLGAGGVVGHAYHAGTLAALGEATGWDPRDAHVVVGTSAGSGVAATLRGGVPATDLYARLVGGALSPEGARLYARLGAPVELPSSPPPFGGGVPLPAAPRVLARRALWPWAGRPGTFLAALLPEGRFDTEAVGARVRGFHERWPERPMWICALRLDDGRRVVFGRAGAPEVDVATAVEASSAIPGFFRPVVIEGVRHVDGGTHSPSNADLLAGEHLDLVVVLSPMSAVRAALRGPVPAVAGRLMHSRTLAAEVRAVRRTGTPVVVFQPTPGEVAAMGFNAMDFRRREEVARAARESALRRLERADVRTRLRALSAA
jgi:NTE family protein